ncbi:MAG: hypothetical protein P8X57_16505, partial [Cyclobacteriaceae bacterium]
DNDLFNQDRRPTVLDRIDRRYGLNAGFPMSADYKGVVHVSHFNNEDRFAASSEFASGDTLDFLQLKGLRAGFEIKRDNLNRKQYPNDGIAMRLAFDYFSVNEHYIPGSSSAVPERRDDHNFFRIKASVEQYFKRRNFSTGYLFEAVFSNQPAFSTDRASVINAPAFKPIMDSPTLLLQNFVGYNYLSGGLRNVFTISDLLEFRLEGYAFKRIDALSPDSEQLPASQEFDRSIKLAATGGFVLHSPLGPVSVPGIS